MLKYKLLSVVSFVLFFPVFIFSSIVLIIASFVYLPLFYILDKFFCRLIMSTFFIFPKIVGSFPSDGTYIIMMNHSSFIDAFLFPLIPRGFYSGITAVKNLKIPVFSALLRRIQAIPIERRNLQSAINSIKRAERVLSQGIHIGILPEGTRTLNGVLGPLKKGGFHMAINTTTPILPVGISGAFSFKPKNRWWIKPCTIRVNIGEIINTNKYENLGLEGLRALVEKRIKQLSGELNEDR